MNSLLVASILFLGVFWLNPIATSGRRQSASKVKCYKTFKAGNSCKSRMKIGRVTVKDCCESQGGKAYQIILNGKKKCFSCKEAMIEENWSKWSRWTKCNSKCGPGISRRTRKCLDIKDIGCPGKSSDKKKCVNTERPNCPIDGGWSDWMNWTECSTSCGVGHKLRFRSCTNPKPQYGGRDCQGVREEKAECMLRPHCPIDGGWGEWKPWTGCTVTCGIGKRQRTRECNNPKPKYGGKPCDSKGIETQSCSTYKKCAESSGSGSGDFSGSSGDDGSGSGGASGNGAIEALDESVDDEGSAGPRENTFENGTAETRNASDFDFS